MSKRSEGVLGIGMLVCLVASLSAILIRDWPRARPEAEIAPSEQLVMALVVSGFCGATETPGFGEDLAALRSRLAKEAADSDLGFVSIGVAVDPLAKDGIEVLERFGPFDELHVGRGWQNTAAMDLLFGEHGVRAAIPHVMVFRRRVETEAPVLEFSKDSLVLDLAGIDEIRSFAAAGA